MQAQKLFHLSLPGLLAARHQRTSSRGALYGSSAGVQEVSGLRVQGFLGFGGLGLYISSFFKFLTAKPFILLRIGQIRRPDLTRRN